MRRTISRSAAFLHGLALFVLSLGAVQAATVTTFSPQGEVAEIRQVRATFSESMVPFGDLRQADPFNIKCPGGWYRPVGRRQNLDLRLQARHAARHQVLLRAPNRGSRAWRWR
jgi:hypothetical protein